MYFSFVCISCDIKENRITGLNTGNHKLINQKYSCQSLEQLSPHQFHNNDRLDFKYF